MGPASAADLAAADQLRHEEQATALADGRTALDRLSERERALAFHAPDDADLDTPEHNAYNVTAVAAALGITEARLVEVLGGSKHPVAEPAGSATAQPYLAQIARVLLIAREALTPDRVPMWLNTPMTAFDAETPLALILSHRASALAYALDDAMDGGA